MFLRRLAVLGTLAGSFAIAKGAAAQTATQVVTFQVNAVSQMAVSGNPSPLVITSATAGTAPTSVSSSATSYSLTTNEPNKKITASLNEALPSGVTLEIALAAPTGAASAGHVPLTTSTSDLVTGITSTNASSLPITYRLNATAQALMAAPAARTVTFTIVTGT